MSEAYKNSITRVKRNNDHLPIGAGVLVGARLILTCAHVVNSALGREPLNQELPPPDSRISFDFPLVAPGYDLAAKVTKWLPPEKDGNGDLALLELAAVPPDQAAIAKFVDPKEVYGHRFRAFGFPDKHAQGKDGSGVLRGRNAIQRLMMEQENQAQNFALRGFSGTGVWDETLEAMIGLIVLGDFDAAQISAFLIPTDQIKIFWPEFQTLENNAARLPFEPESILVPGGSFQMGNSIDPAPWEPHEVDLPAYSISKLPVTNVQYAKFVETQPQHRPSRGWRFTQPPPDKLDVPVVWVNWQNAIAYCQWLSQQTQRKYCLPSEAEWEKAVKLSFIKIDPLREWTRTLWGENWKTPRFTYPYRLDERDNPEMSGYRVYRLWEDGPRKFSRGIEYPSTSDGNLSFRVVSPDP